MIFLQVDQKETDVWMDLRNDKIDANQGYNQLMMLRDQVLMILLSNTKLVGTFAKKSAEHCHSIALD